tara:strand:- start:14 stop:844 length:831 start_codon:yes stop_codon:yes gene_type:complete
MVNGKGDKWRGGWTSQYADNHNKIFGEKMNKIYIFDVDGTLTPSRQKMTEKFARFFDEWTSKNTYYLVTGSDLAKTQEQVPTAYIERANGIFTCCGNQLWREGNTKQWPIDLKLIYENKFNPPNNLLTYLGEQLRMTDYPVKAGNHIEDRGTLLNFSVVGRDCTLVQRKDYHEYDKVMDERKGIAKYIRENWSDIDAVIGGQISIDIYPKGNDKSQILEHIEKENPKGEIIFIGDGIENGGNDYPLAHLMDNIEGCDWYHTEGWEQTQKILEKLSD